MRTFRKSAFLTGLIILLLSGGLALVYRYIKSGGLRARQTPSTIETSFAQDLVELSVPKEMKSLTNPASVLPDSTDVAAGRDLYQKYCMACHNYDGSGKTAAGSGLYPPPLDLRPAALLKRDQSDGELFYFIRYGVRNTGMPGWQLPDQQVWQLVSYLRNLPQTADLTAKSETTPWPTGAQYVGSATCQPCHDTIYQHWRKTPMANVVRDPREYPDAIIPDLSQTNPLVHLSHAGNSPDHCRRECSKSHIPLH